MSARGRLVGLCIVLFIGLGAMLAASAQEQASSPVPSVSRSGEAASVAEPAGKQPFDSSTSAMPLLELALWRHAGYEAELKLRMAYRDLHPLNPGGTRFGYALVFPMTAQLPGAEEYRRLAGLRTKSGTHGAYVRLIKGDAECIVVAREPSRDELKAAGEAGVELDVRPCARDAFVFITNTKNPVDSLTQDQIRAIYAGKTKTWREVGGDAETRDGQIVAYTRNRNSGSQELMVDLVMKDTKFAVPDRERLLMGMGGPIDMVAGQENALAYSVYYYERFMNRNPQVKLLAVDGVKPSYETIADGSYPLTTKVYVVVRKDTAADSRAVEFRDWLTDTNEGQWTVRLSGYVPWHLEPQTAGVGSRR